MKLKWLLLVMLVILTSTLFGCTNKDEIKSLKGEMQIKEEQIDSLNTIIKTNEDTITTLKERVSELEVKTNANSNTVLNQAMIVINMLKNKDMINLAEYIHPSRGVRFTPYSYIETQTNLIFQAEEITTLMDNTQLFTWGEFDGSGEPIDATFSDYYDLFVYDVDFAEPDLIGNNTIVGTSGNMVNNISQAYPTESFVEFHFSGSDAQYAGMDWKSLRLVFENVDGNWYLVGVIHDQWTI